jgi:hypothetical protein
LPDSVPNDAIFTIIETESLSYSSGNTDEENQDAIDYLRQELGLQS